MLTRRSACDGCWSGQVWPRTTSPAMASARGPLSRTTPTALSPVGVASATMVSAASASGPGVLRLAARAALGLAARFRRLPVRAVHQPLLADLQHVRHGPVEGQ